MSHSDLFNIRDLHQKILTLSSKIEELENQLMVQKKEHAKEIYKILNENTEKKGQSFTTSELLWQTIFQAIGQPTLILDKDQRIKAANKAVLEACQKTEDEIKGMYCYHLFHSSQTNNPPVGCPCNKIIKSGSICTEEMEVEALNGIYLVCCTPVYNELGEIESIIHIATDITSQKIIQNALKESEKRLNALLGALPDLMFRLDHNGIILDFKADTSNLYVDINEVIGGDIKKLLPPVVSNLIINKIQSTLQSNQMQTFEYQLDVPGEGLKDYEARIVESGLNEVIAVVRDITLEKKNREALKASETNMLIAQKMAKLGSWELDPKTGIGIWSAEMYNLLNFNPSDEVPHLDNFFKKIHPEDRQRVWDAHHRAIETGNRWSVEFRNNAENEFLKIFHSTIEPVINENKELIKLVGTLQDITGQRQAEEKIKKLNRIYALLSDVNKTIIRIPEPDELFKKICQIAIDRGGFKLVWIGIINKETSNFKISSYAGDYADYIKLLESMMQNPSFESDPRNSILRGEHYVSNNLKSDISDISIINEVIPLEIQSLAAFPIKSSDQVIGTISFYSHEINFFDDDEIKLLNELAADVSFALDVYNKETLKKEAESALAKQYHLFQFFIDTLPDHIYFKDTESRFITINKAQANIFGLKDPLLARGKTDFDYFTEEHARKAFDDEQSILKTQDPIIDKEEKETWPDGSESWVSTTKLPLYDQQGKLIGTFGLSRDTTSRRIMMEEIRQAKEKAEESDRLKTAFLANMSHEIRTPMNGILGFADLLKNPNLKGEQQQKYIRVIEQSGRRMLNIINDIFDISKIEAGQMDIHRGETHINQLIDHLSTFFGPEANHKSLMLGYKVGLSNDRCRIITDKNKLAQILTNLIKNALKFTENGLIEFGYSLKANFLEFFVRDSGIGISQENQRIIFERFRQGSESFSREYEGAGLGLAISKALVEMLGGSIWLESEVNKGSCFYFTLPYEEYKGESIKEEELSNNNTGQPITILIADDDETSMLYLKEILNAKNIHLLTALNGKEVIELILKDTKIDLILMDIKMPVLNGLEATKQIKKIRPEIPIIAISAFALNSDENKAKEAGCDDYISKPVDKNKLFYWIETVRKRK